MQPVRELLDRIRWDPRFGQARFEVGYYDRLQRRVLRVPLKHIGYTGERRMMLAIADELGEVHSLPLHRLRDVYRNGVKIWHRSGPEHSG